MNRSFGKDLTVGSIPRTLAKFAIPILLGNLLSSGYSIINNVWVGHLLGGNAVGAAAMTFPIILLMVAVCVGGTTATSVLIAQYFGAKRNDEIQKIVNTSWTMALVFVFLFMAAGITGAKFLLGIMNVPAEIMPMAISYLRLSFAGFASMYCWFLVASSLRAIGNAKAPLLFVAFGTLLNAALDPLLILGIGPFPCLGLNGAAWASLVSGATGALSGFIYLKTKYGQSPLFPNRLILDMSYVSKIIKIGFPSFVQQSLLSITIGVMTTLVNGFGPMALDAFGVTSRIDTLVALPALAVLSAVSMLTAQNLGAQKPERIKEVFKWGIVINTPAILMISIICLAAPNFVMKLFIKDPRIIEIGVQYLRIMGVGYLFLIPPYVSNGIIIGAGKTTITMLISFVSLCLVRIPLAAWLSRSELGLTGVWLGTALSFPIFASLGLLYYRSGKWKQSTTIAQTVRPAA